MAVGSIGFQPGLTYKDNNMANLRLIYDNAADRATLAASSTSGSLAAPNLQLNEKAAIWRSTATTATVTATWTTAEPVDSVALGWTNLTPLATVTVDLYNNEADTSPVSTTTVNPDTAFPLGEFVWGVDPLVMGGAQSARVATQAQVWMPTGASCKKVVITISDPTNPLGYVEASRLSIGMRYEMEVQKVGFIDSDLTLFGCSPDGIIGDNDGLEVKCPEPTAHVGYLRDGGLPSQYFLQVHGALLTTGRPQWHFLSYHRDFPKLVVVVERDDRLMNRMMESLAEFTTELQEAVELLHGMEM